MLVFIYNQFSRKVILYSLASSFCIHTVRDHLNLPHLAPHSSQVFFLEQVWDESWKAEVTSGRPSRAGEEKRTKTRAGTGKDSRGSGHAKEKMGWLHPRSKQGSWAPVVSERGQRFGNFSQGHKAGKWQRGEEKASWQFLEGGAVWSWSHRQGKKARDGATSPGHQGQHFLVSVLPGAYETAIKAQQASVTKNL